MSGTLYSDEGSIQITNGNTIKVVVGTSTPSVHSTTTNSGTGTWSLDITGGSIAAGTPILIFVDATSSVRASLVTKASSTENITGLNLYQNYLIISHEATTGTSTTMTDLAFYDGDDDADITYTANSDNLVLTENTGLYIKTGKSLTLGTNATTTAFTNYGTTTAPSGNFTIQGDYINNATFLNNNGTVTMSSSSIQNIVGSVATSSPFYNLVIDGEVNLDIDKFTTVYDSEQQNIWVFAMDYSNNVLYVGAAGGIIYRCATGTGCDEFTDFTTSYDTTESNIYSLTIDSVNGVLYAGSGSGGIIYRCLLSTACDASGDFTVAYDTPQANIYSLTIDSVNGVLYAGSNSGGIIYRCLLSTACDASGDFTTAYDTTETTIQSLTIDSVNGVLYAGSGSGGIIYRCLLSTACDASGDFTIAYDTTQATIYALAIDTQNAVLYAGSGSGGIIYRCLLSTACDASGDFSVATDTLSTSIYSLAVDPVNGVLYAGSITDGLLYQCFTSTGCDDDNDFKAVFASSTGSRFYSLLVDSNKSVLYIGSGRNGIIYRCLLSMGCSYEGNTLHATNLTNNSSGTLYTPETVVLSGDYTQNGTVPFKETSLYFNGISSQNLSGILTATSALPVIHFSGSGTKTFLDEAESVSDFIIDVGSTVVAPSTTLTIGGNFIQNGVYNHNSGTLKLTGLGTTATGTLTGSSTLNHLASVIGLGEDVFSIAYDTTESAIHTLTIDSVNGVLYAGSGSGGIIYRCLLLTGCDESTDFTIAYDTTESAIHTLTIDSVNGVLYAGSGSGGIIYRCLLSTACDASGDFTTAYDTTETTIQSLTIDSVNGVLYAGSGSGGIIYRCLLSTACDASGDFTIAYDTTETTIQSFTIDSVNGVLYAGSNSGGIIYRCLLSTACDASGDYTVAYDTSDNGIYSLTIDSINSALYVTTIEGSLFNWSGRVYRCLLSTGCDESVDFTIAYSLTGPYFRSLSIDSINGVLYAATTDSFSSPVYRCSLNTFCDSADDFSLTHNSSDVNSIISEFKMDNITGTLYAAGLNGVIYRRAGGPILGASASTGNLTIATGKSMTAPADTLTISGDYTNYGTFIHNNGTVVMSSSSPQQLIGKVATSSPFYNLVIDGGGPKQFANKWNVATDTSESNIATIAVDATNGVLYAGSSPNGIIYRCDLETGCDSFEDFTVAYDTSESDVNSIIIDATNGVLYAGSSPNGIIYRCDLSTACDASGDFTVAYDTTQTYIFSLFIDSVNGVLYAGSANGGIIYRCDLSTACDASGDFTVAYDTPQLAIYSLAIDSINSVLYVGTYPLGIIYRCDLSTSCDASGDFTVAYDTPYSSVDSLVIDTINSVLYGGSSNSGIIYRCDLSTSCDASGDFTVAYDTPSTYVLSLAIDSNNSVLYASGYGVIYSCSLTTGCDEGSDFLISYNVTDSYVLSMAIDSYSNSLFVGSGPNEGLIYKCNLYVDCADSTISFNTVSLTINPFSSFYTPDTVTISGDYTQNGTTSSLTSSNFYFTGASQTLSGTLTGTSSLPNTYFSGGGVKTFSGSAIINGDLNNDLGSTVIAPSGELTVARDFIQNGTFTNNGGIVSLTGFGAVATGTLTGVSAFSHVNTNGLGLDNFIVVATTSETNIDSLVVDSVNGVLYAGSTGSGIIYRCVLSSSCDSLSDFTVAYDTPSIGIYSLAVDSVNGVLYAGSGNGGIIYRCDLSTSCDASGDFTVAYDTTQTYIFSLFIDSVNGVLYAGGFNGGIIYRCDLSTSCDASGDFTVAYDTTSTYILDFTIDYVNNVLYIGSGTGGIIYRCDLSTSCDASGDFTVAYDTTQSTIETIAIDTVNDILYAGSGNGGIIYRCDLSTSCDASGDFTVVYDSPNLLSIYSITFDTMNNLLYAVSSKGFIYQCELSTNCDESSDFILSDIIPVSAIYSISYDLYTSSLFAATSNGSIYRRAGGPIFGANASTTNFTIAAGKNVNAPAELSISGNYTNNGAFITDTTSTTTFSGTSAQTIAGKATGTSAFSNTVFTGAGSKTFASTSAAVRNFLVQSNSGEVIVPENLSLTGNYINNSTTTHAGAKWTLQTSTTTNNWYGVTYGNGLFVAVAQGAGSDNRVMTSSDGVVWTSRTSAADNVWNSITYGNSLFVAVSWSGSGNRVMTSPDGITWTSRASVVDNDWQSVTYGNGLFVAVSSNGSADGVMTSPDGINWSTSTSAADNEWNSVTYGNGLFVAVSGSFSGSITDRVMTSPDGVVWTPRTAAADNYWNSVTYGNGLFVAVGSFCSSDCVMTSPDGITWTSRTSAADNFWTSVTYGNGLFVAVSQDGSGNRVMTSPDGVTWTTRSTSGIDNSYAEVTYGNGVFVAVGYNGTGQDVMTSHVSTTTFSGTTAQSLSGNLIGASALGSVSFTSASTTTFSSNASTSNFIVSASSTVVTPTTLSISGNYQNNGTIDTTGNTTYLTGSNPQSFSGTTTFNNLYLKNYSRTGTTTFNAPLTVGGTFTADGSTYIGLKSGATSTIANLTLNGSSIAPISFGSTATGTKSNLSVTGSTAITYTRVQDSSACGSTGGVIDVSAGNNTDGGNTECWNFTAPANPTLNLESNLQFYVGQATTTFGTVTVTDAETPSITSTNDIRLTIATTTTNFRFDTTNTTPTFSGTASGKVASTVSYIDGGVTLLIDVTTNFTATDTIAISGLSVGSFAAVSSSTSQLALHTDGDSIGTPADLSNETIKLTGALTSSNHDAGQATNQFSYQNRTAVPLFNFKLTPAGESATITDAVITLSGIENLDTSDITNFKLYQDNNSDGDIDGGDTLIDGSGILTINGQHGAITFSTDFLATTTTNFIVIGDTNTIPMGGAVVFSVNTTSFTTIGLTSGFALYAINTTSNIQHLRNGGSGGGNSQIGGAPPAGASVETGGGSGTGGETGQGTDGANIASDPDFQKPTGLGSDNDWTNPTNAYASDGVYATASSTNFRQSYINFGFNVPGGNTIQGLAVKLDASGSTAAGTIDVAISWDGGNSYTTAKATPTLSGTDIVYIVGGGTDTWGRSWTPGEFDNSLFRLRVTAQPSTNTLRLDALEVRVYHQAGGGGAGGGGGI